MYHDAEQSDRKLKREIARKWTFGVSVVAALAVMIIKAAWMLFSLPADDNGGGIVGALAVGIYDLVLSLVVLEVVRRVYLRTIR
jgi:hypothetical protein